MRLLLINPNMKGCYGEMKEFEPIGLEYVAHNALDFDEVYLVDAFAEDRPDSYLMQIAQDYDVIGISIPFTGMARIAYELSDKMKAQYPEKKIVFGGSHTAAMTYFPEDHPFWDGARSADLIIVGEGDGFSADMLEGPRVRKHHVDDLENLNHPDHECVDLDRYPEMAINTSRGCPYRCSFCDIHVHMGPKYRTRSPESIQAELWHPWAKGYMDKVINLEEDNFAFDKERAMRIAEIFHEYGFTWVARTGLRADRLDEEMVEHFHRCGCGFIRLAPESGSQRVVDEVIGKKQDLQAVRDVVMWCKEIGLPCGLFILVGHPGETLEEMQETVRFSQEMRAFGAAIRVNICAPLPGTRLWKTCEENGYFRGDPVQGMVYNSENFYLETEDWSRDDVLRIYKQIRALKGYCTWQEKKFGWLSDWEPGV